MNFDDTHLSLEDALNWHDWNGQPPCKACKQRTREHQDRLRIAEARAAREHEATAAVRAAEAEVIAVVLRRRKSSEAMMQLETPDLVGLITDDHLPWKRDALCRETPDVNFYPARGEDSEPAKAVCRRCLVREDCLSYALATEDRFGIWGATSERERRRVRKRKTAA